MRSSDTVASRLGLGPFLRFAGLSGLGWLLDAAILLLLVELVAMPAGIANVISSCTAALTVFLVSRRFVFRTASHFFLARTAFYVCYVLAVIFVASFALAALVHWLHPLLVGRVPDHWLTATTAALAKVAITPPQLMLNFLVARFLSERQIASRAE